MGALELLEVELFHLEKRLHRPPRFLWIGIADQRGQRRRNDLPRDTELVFQPSALLRVLVPAGRELLPVAIDLFLRVTHDLERNRFAELELWSTVQRGDCAARDIEVHGHDASWFATV